MLICVIFVAVAMIQDPLIIARLLVVGRDCVTETQYKVR